jgi:hypothetical protein
MTDAAIALAWSVACYCAGAATCWLVLQVGGVGESSRQNHPRGGQGLGCVVKHHDSLFTIHAPSYLSAADGRVVAVATSRGKALAMFDQMRSSGALVWPHGEIP